MEIAGITGDGKTISHHFGRAAFYLALTLEDGKIAMQEIRGENTNALSLLADIYHLFSPGIYRYAIRLLGDECLAGDHV